MFNALYASLSSPWLCKQFNASTSVSTKSYVQHSVSTMKLLPVYLIAKGLNLLMFITQKQ